MKKIIIALTTVLCLAGPAAFAAEGIPPAAVAFFKSNFKEAQDISWENEHGMFIARFVLDGSVRSAYFDQDGNLLVVARQIDITGLPGHMAIELATSFQSYSIVSLFEMSTGTGPSYFAVVTDGRREKLLKASSRKWRCLRTRKS